MAADALAPFVTGTSSTMVLIMQCGQAIFFKEERFQLPAPSMLRNDRKC